MIPGCRSFANARGRGLSLARAILVLAALGVATHVRAAFVDETDTRLPGTAAISYAAAAADIDGDGDLDVAVAEAGGTRLLVNQGNGVFTDGTDTRLPTAAQAATGVLFADVTGDNGVDIVLAVTGARNRLWINDGAGTFTDETQARLPADTARGMAAAAADIDGDGDTDLVFANHGSGNTVLVNDGAGTFTDESAGRLPAATRSTLDILATDLSGDGAPDLLTVNADGDHRLLLNDGSGVFTDTTAARLPAAAPTEGQHAVAADMDGDGDLDLLLAGGGAGLGLWLNDGAGTFSDVTADRLPVLDAFAIRAMNVDADDDGDMDIVVGAAGQDVVLINDGTGSFAVDAGMLPTDTARTFALLAADVDGDFDSDLLQARPGAANRLLINAIAAPRIRLAVTPSQVESGSPVTITVAAADEDGLQVGFPTLTVNGAPVALTDGAAVYVPAAPGTFTATATAEDTLGNAATRGVDFTAVANVVPVVDAGPAASLHLGDAFAGNGSFSDPGDTAWTATVDYGDGDGEQALTLNGDRTFALAHTYTAHGTFTVTVRVNDGDDIGVDTTTVTIVNQPPVLSTIPGRVVQDPVPFPAIELDRYVTDPDHADATIVWTVTGNTALNVALADRVVTLTYAPGTRVTETLTFTATDPLGLSASTTADFTVAEDTGDYQRPYVAVTALPAVRDVGETVNLQLTVTDDGDVIARELTVNDQPVVLDADGKGTFTSVTPGVFTVAGTAMDAAGNTGYAETEFRLLLAGDTTPPTALITAPDSDASITTPTAIVGTAADTSFTRYTLAAAPADGGQFVTFFTSTTPITAGTLGTLDPTLMENGQYDVRLTVEDASGNIATSTRRYRVEGHVKVGPFSIRFRDLRIPVAGLDIDIIRTYDNRDRSPGAFGYGWKLETSDIKVEESNVPGDGWYQDEQPWLLIGSQYTMLEQFSHHVTVTYPDGRLERFIAHLSETHQFGAPLQEVDLTWTAASGTLSSLTAIDDNLNLKIIGNGGFVGPVQLWYNDLSNVFDPDTYRITGRDGYAFVVSQAAGLQSITDPDGNTLTFNAAGITHSAGLSVVFTRDTSGRITKITDPDGGEILYVYDAYGDLTAVTDQEGGTMRFAYDRDHNLVKIIDQRGNVLQQNQFDDHGRIAAITGSDGQAVTYNHDLDQRTETVVNRLGAAATISYDADGNVVAYTAADGGQTTNTFDADGNRTSTTDPLGRTSTFAYDANGQMTSRTDALGHTWAFTYDAQGNILTTTDPDGHVRTRTYDASGHLLTEDDGAGGVRTMTYDANGNNTSYTDRDGNAAHIGYNAQGHIASWTSTTGVTSTLQTTANGFVTGETYTVQTDAGPQTVNYDYTWDRTGKITRMTGPHGARRDVAYDAFGAYTSVESAGGQRVDMDYNNAGLIDTMTLADGQEAHYEYDAEGRLTKLSGPGFATSQRSYDAVGRLLTQTRADGGVAARSYDLAGQVTAVTGPEGAVTQFDYDDAGRRTRMTDALNGQSSFEYSAGGKLIATVDPAGRRLEYERDAEGRPTLVRFADGGEVAMAYNGEGHLTSHTDGLNHTTVWTHDATGQLASVTDPLGNTTTYARNEEAALTSITDAGGHQTLYEADRFRRVTHMTLPLGQQFSATYDAGGDLVTLTDFAGRQQTLEYDSNHHPTRQAGDDGTVRTFTFDARGHILTMTNAVGTWTFTYDVAGRIAKVTEPDGRYVSYTYDLNGRRTSVTTASGSTHYVYDALGRMTQMTDPNGDATDYTYDASSRPLSVTHPNGTTETYTYDVRGLPASVTVKDAADTVLFSEAYTRDLNGRITRSERQDGTQTDYTYDDAGRLTAEAVTPPAAATATTTYTYDAVGNRTGVTDADGARAFVYDANDRLLSDGTYTYTYDDAGNVTTRTGAGETLSFTYNGLGNLTRVDRVGGVGPASVQYLYDPLDRRVGRIVDGVREDFLLDRNTAHSRVLEESDGGGAVTARNFYGLRLDSRETGGTVSVLHADQLGSVRLRTDAAGAAAAAYHYDAFGRPTAAVVDSNPYRFGGERYDDAISAVDLRARFYWPTAGRFLQMDPAPPDIRHAGTLNRYAYALNDPVNLIDPSGHFFTLAGAMVTLSLQNTIDTMAQQMTVNFAALAFAMFGGFEIFDFPGGANGFDAKMVSPTGIAGGAGGGVSFGGINASWETWKFRKVDPRTGHAPGLAIFAYQGAHMPYGTGMPSLTASVGLWRNAKVWESPTPPDYEGGFISFSFSMGTAVDIIQRLRRGSPAGFGLSIGGSVEFFMSPVPNHSGAGYLDPNSPSFGQALQAHGTSIGVGISNSGSIVSSGPSFSVTWYELVWAADTSYYSR